MLLIGYAIAILLCTAEIGSRFRPLRTPRNHIQNDTSNSYVKDLRGQIDEMMNKLKEDEEKRLTFEKQLEMFLRAAEVLTIV